MVCSNEFPIISSARNTNSVPHNDKSFVYQTAGHRQQIKDNKRYITINKLDNIKQAADNRYKTTDTHKISIRQQKSGNQTTGS